MYKRHLESLWQSALDRHVDHQQAEAEALYREILDQHPGHAGALGMLAVILADGTNEVEAEAVILRHLAQSPDDGGSLLLLGQLRARQGDDEAAASAIPSFFPFGISGLYEPTGRRLLDRHSGIVRLRSVRG